MVQGVFGNFDQSRSLATAFRDLETLGFVQRVKARANVEGKARFHRCVKLLRQPTDDELRAFFSPSQLNENRTQVDDDRRGAGKLLESAGDDEQDLEVDDPDDIVDLATPYSITASDMAVSRWTPNRQISHIAREIVDEAGEEGITLPVRVTIVSLAP